MQSDVRQSPAYMLWLASNAWTRCLRRALEPWKLTHVQFAVLSSVERLGTEHGCPCQAEVARWLDIDENMNSQVIRSLEKRGLLVRSPHEADRRAHRLTLTEAGLRVTLEARAEVKAQSAVFFAPLGESESTFVGLVSRLIESEG